jgi:uncharacterized protein HemX
MRIGYLVLSLIAAAIVIYVACCNMTAVAVAGFGAPLQVPFGAMMLGGFALGLASVGSAWATQKKREIKGEQNQIQWAKEDQKLLNEIADDRSKQLEAKIATLETALQTEIKKRKDAVEKLSQMQKG